MTITVCPFCCSSFHDKLLSKKTNFRQSISFWRPLQSTLAISQILLGWLASLLVPFIKISKNSFYLVNKLLAFSHGPNDLLLANFVSTTLQAKQQQIARRSREEWRSLPCQVNCSFSTRFWGMKRHPTASKSRCHRFSSLCIGQVLKNRKVENSQRSRSNLVYIDAHSRAQSESVALRSRSHVWFPLFNQRSCTHPLSTKVSCTRAWGSTRAEIF